VSDVDPIEVTDLEAGEFSARDPRPVSDRYRSDLAEMFSTPAEPRRQREGLPAGYRMRADAHYVDQLSAPADPRPGPEAARARAVPVGLDDVAAALREAFADIGAAAAWLADPVSPLARVAAVDVIRAQSWRASWLLGAQTTLAATSLARFQPRRLGLVLGRLVDGFGPESRLTGVDLQMLLPDWNLQADVDESVLIAGLTGAVVATLGLMGPPRGAVISLMASPPAGEAVTIDVAQDMVAAPAEAGGRFFDLTWRDRPGGPAAAVGAWAARVAAMRHGGSAVLVANDGGGTTIRLTLGR
jgi:hypothetical protein